MRDYLVKRLKSEHVSLVEAVNDLNIKAEMVNDWDILYNLNLLQHLRVDVHFLLKELSQHEEWEEQQIYPIVLRYYRMYNDSSIDSSIAVLEREHRLVKECFQPFLKLSKEILCSLNEHEIQFHEQLTLCMAYLSQGCSIFQEHIDLEEGLIYPLVDEIWRENGNLTFTTY